MLFLFCLVIRYIFHEIGRLALKYGADFFKSVNRQMLNCSQTDGGDRGRTDSCSVCKLFLCHATHGKNDFDFEFYHFCTFFPFGF